MPKNAHHLLTHHVSQNVQGSRQLERDVLPIQGRRSDTCLYQKSITRSAIMVRSVCLTNDASTKYWATDKLCEDTEAGSWYEYSAHAPPPDCQPMKPSNEASEQEKI